MMRASILAAAVCSLVSASPALANLCPQGDSPQQRHLAEAVALQTEAFTAAAGYAGSPSYDARVLECNRRRDSLGNDVEAAITATQVFPQTLAPLLVSGHLWFFDAFPERYGYELRRDAGTWTVTVAARFHLPGSNPQALDVPFLLATAALADGGMGIACNDAAHPMVVEDAALPDAFQACRVGRGERFGGKAPDALLFRYWQTQIETFWTRPGFAVRLRVVNLGDVDDLTLKGYDKDGVTWEVRFNDLPETRALYKAVPFRPHPLFSGLPATTFVHEFGHQLGNDDEYPEDKKFAAFRDCGALGGISYIMCDEVLTPQKTNAKGIYPWIVTRRYAVADPSKFQCKTDGDCGTGKFCAAAALGLGAHLCEDKRARCTACGADDECAAPMACAGKPLGKCAGADTLPVGGACCRDAQCASGSCNADGICQCTDNAQCAGGQFCDKGTLGIGKNQCVPAGTRCSTCDADKQCTAPMTCAGKPLGRCASADRLPVGGACCRDAQCASGSCNADGICQCVSDGQCGAGRFCDLGTLGVGKNQCKSLGAECAACSADHQCTAPAVCAGAPLGHCTTKGSVDVGRSCCTDSECRSGSCASSTRTCQCASDSDCPSAQHCDKGTLGVGLNQCVPDKGLCSACSGDDVCPPPAVCLAAPIGHCAVAGSSSLGHACCADKQCTTGLCQAGACTCTDDTQCPRGQSCKKPLFGTHRCE